MKNVVGALPIEKTFRVYFSVFYNTFYMQSTVNVYTILRVVFLAKYLLCMFAKQNGKRNLRDLIVKAIPSKLLTSTMTPTFNRWSQRIKKIVETSRLKKDTLSLRLLSLKYILKCQKKFQMVVNLCFLHFSLCWF